MFIYLTDSTDWRVLWPWACTWLWKHHHHGGDNGGILIHASKASMKASNRVTQSRNPPSSSFPTFPFLFCQLRPLLNLRRSIIQPITLPIERKSRANITYSYCLVLSPKMIFSRIGSHKGNLTDRLGSVRLHAVQRVCVLFGFVVFIYTESCSFTWRLYIRNCLTVVSSTGEEPDRIILRGRQTRRGSNIISPLLLVIL